MGEPNGYSGPRMRTVDQIDSDTGEVISEGVLVFQPRRSPHPYGTDWAAVTMSGILKLVMTPGIGITEVKVFCKMFERLDYENYIQITQADVARDTGIAKPHVSTAIKKLVAAGALIVGPKVGKLQTYRLDPRIAWKGGKNHLRKALSVIEGGKGRGSSQESVERKKTASELEREELERAGQQTLFDRL